MIIQHSRIVLQDYIHAVQDAEARRDRLTRQIEELLPNWSMGTSRHGIASDAWRRAEVVAVTIVAEVERLFAALPKRGN